MPDIRQEIDLPASPRQVYAALTTAETFGAVTGGAPTEIAEDGAFSLFGGRISGHSVERKPGTRLVQAWRAAHWPEGIYSIVRFELEPAGTGTRIVFEQRGHPDDASAHLAEGWHRMYWQPLKTHFDA